MAARGRHIAGPRRLRLRRPVGMVPLGHSQKRARPRHVGALPGRSEARRERRRHLLLHAHDGRARGARRALRPETRPGRPRTPRGDRPPDRRTRRQLDRRAHGDRRPQRAAHLALRDEISRRHPEEREHQRGGRDRETILHREVGRVRERCARPHRAPALRGKGGRRWPGSRRNSSGRA